MLTKAEIARLRSLREKKHRDNSGLFAVEGEKVVNELIGNGHPLVEVYATTAWQPAATLQSGCPQARLISEDEMARISHFPTPSPVLAVAVLHRKALDKDALNRGFTLLLDGIQDAGNLGTLLRVADWYAFDRVVMSPDCVDSYNQKVIHASMGSFCRVPFFSCEPSGLLAGLSIPILGCDLAGESVHEIPPLKAAIVAIGSEGRGLSAGVRAAVTRFVTIPRFGHAESLNAGVAAAVVCDNLRRTASATTR